MDYHPTDDERVWAMLAYACAFCFPIVAPLVIFLVRRRSRFVSFHALQALFIPLALLLLEGAFSAVAWVLGLVGLGLLAVPLGLVMTVVPFFFWLFKVIGAFRSFAGAWYRVPLVWRYAENMA
jgi:uncharacterized membrane protein